VDAAGAPVDAAGAPVVTDTGALGGRSSEAGAGAFPPGSEIILIKYFWARLSFKTGDKIIEQNYYSNLKEIE
jgi:hypothetical protein